MDDLLREAIADAKAVRETALANAKIALEEAFTPRLQSMLSKKIAAEAEDFEETDAEETDHEESDYEETDHEENDLEVESSEDSLAPSQDDAVFNPSEEDAEESDHEEMREEDAEESDDEMRESEDAEEEDSVEEAEDAEEEDELDLESVLRELEADLDDNDSVEEEYDNNIEDGHDKDEAETPEEDKLAENDVTSGIGDADNKVNPAANDSSKTGAQGPEGEGSDKKAGDELDDHETVDDLTEAEDAEEGDLDLDEVLRALTEEEAEENDAEENEKLKAEIKEYRIVINFMRKNLNEVNLLNAKLLFSNKLFRAFGLNNNQKLKVVETFDRTTNLREVKLVYATLAESFKRPTSKIVASKGSSSKAVRSTKPVKQEVLSEGQELRNRFKKLANIL